MHNIECNVVDEQIVLNGYPEDYKVCKIPFEEKYSRVYSLLLSKYDLEKGIKNLQLLGDNEDINEVILKATIVDFIKCFTSSEQRIQLDKDKIYKGVPEAKQAFDYYKNLRNKFIAHDASQYAQSIVGIIIDTENKKVIEAIGAGMVVRIDNAYAQTLFNLADRALKYVEGEIESEMQRIANDYRQKDWEEIKSLENLEYMVPENL